MISDTLHFNDGYLKRVQRAYDLMAEEYDIIDSNVSPFYVNDYQILNYHVEKLLPLWKDKVVLDVGCGTGIQTVQYARGAKRVFAIDLSENLIRKLQKKTESCGFSNVTIIQSDATRIPLENDSVDFVSAYGDVIGHIPSFRQAVGEMARVCRSGGIMTIQYDNKWHLGLLSNISEMVAAIRTRGAGDVRRWEHNYLDCDQKIRLLYKTFTTPEIETLFGENCLKITNRGGIHILSSLIPEIYQEPNGKRVPFRKFFTKLILTLGKLDFLIGEMHPFHKLGYSAIVVARKL